MGPCAPPATLQSPSRQRRICRRADTHRNPSILRCTRQMSASPRQKQSMSRMHPFAGMCQITGGGGPGLVGDEQDENDVLL